MAGPPWPNPPTRLLIEMVVISARVGFKNVADGKNDFFDVSLFGRYSSKIIRIFFFRTRFHTALRRLSLKTLACGITIFFELIFL